MVTLVFFDPTFVYFMDGDRVEIMQLFAPSPHRGNQVGVFKPREVLRDRLAGHVEVCTELSQRLAALRAKGIQQAPPGRVSESLEHIIDVHRSQYMQENTCMARMPDHRRYFHGAQVLQGSERIGKGVQVRNTGTAGEGL